MKFLRKPPDSCPNEGACAVMAEDQRQWHLDKSVSVGHIITTLAAVGAFVAWAMRQESRVTNIEAMTKQNAQAIEMEKADRKDLKNEIRSELREIRAILEGMRGRR